MKRPFEKCDVSKRFREPRGRRIALGPAAPQRQQDDREVGPGRLFRQEVCQRLEIGIADCLVGYDRQSASFGDLLAQCRQIAANIGRKTRLVEDQCCDLSIAPVRGEDNCAFRNRA